MKITKKLLAMVLVLTMTLGLGVTANAASDDKPILALGADLSTDQRAAVLGLLGVDESDLANYDVISITNADEHEYLDKYLDASIIGTRALSSVLPTILQLTRMPESLTSILVCLLPVVLPLQIHSICIIRRLLS